jgi:hypothetical protein
MDTIFITSIGIVAGLLTGLILLVFEYRTGWFAAKAHFTESDPIRKRERISTISGQRASQFFRYMVGFYAAVIGISVLLIVYLERDYRGASTFLDNPTAENVISATIYETRTNSFFNNDIYITLNQVAPSGDITFTLGSPGLENTVLTNIPNGHSLIYDFNSNQYDIRVTNVARDRHDRLGWSRADFVITKLPR